MSEGGTQMLCRICRQRLTAGGFTLWVLSFPPSLRGDYWTQYPDQMITTEVSWQGCALHGPSHILCFIFSILCLGHFWWLPYHFHIAFLEHSIPLRVIKFSHIFSFSSWGEVHLMCHPCDPIRSGRSLYCSATFALHVGYLFAKQPPIHFLRAAATLAMKQLIYLTWKLMIKKDS